MPYKWEELAAHWAIPGWFTTLCEKDLTGDLRFRVGESLEETSCSGCRIALIRLFQDDYPELKPATEEGKWDLFLRLRKEGKLDDVA